MFYDLPLWPALLSHSVTLKNVRGGADVIATYLSGPDGVVSKPGEPVLPLAAVNVTPKDPGLGLVLPGTGFRRGTYMDSAPLTPFSTPPTPDLPSVPAPSISPVSDPG